MIEFSLFSIFYALVPHKFYGRNTLYGKNQKYCKTPTFGYFHG